MTINTSEWNTLQKQVKNWTINGVNKDVKKASTIIANNYKSQIRSGKKGDDTSMPNVTDNTMKRPIGGHSRDSSIRGEVRSSRSPLYARGGAIDSIKSKKVSNGFEIGPTTPHGEVIFSFNANSAKTKRDPLIVSDVQMKILEDHIYGGLDKILGGK